MPKFQGGNSQYNWRVEGGRPGRNEKESESTEKAAGEVVDSVHSSEGPSHF